MSKVQNFSKNSLRGLSPQVTGGSWRDRAARGGHFQAFQPARKGGEALPQLAPGRLAQGASRGPVDLFSKGTCLFYGESKVITRGLLLLLLLP